MNRKANVTLLTVLVALLGGSLVFAAPPKPNVTADISMGTILGTGGAGTVLVTVPVTNNFRSKSKPIEAHLAVRIVAHKCSDTSLPQSNCTEEARGTAEADVAAGATEVFTVTLSVPAGSYILVVTAIGGAKGDSDVKNAFATATVKAS